MRLGCGIKGMMELEAGSVDLVLCDLPSGETAAKFDIPVNLDEFWVATWHCLKPKGIACLMASSFRFAAELLASQPKAFRYDMIWSKSIATGFLNAKIRPLRAHEFVLIFSREVGVYNPQMDDGYEPIHRNSTRGRSHGDNYGHQSSDAGLARVGATDRFPTSVLNDPCLGSTHPDRVHPQQKPDDLFRRLIRTYSNPGELVVDPCAGSGTTERAALADGRRAICWDIQERFGNRKNEQLLIGQDIGAPVSNLASRNVAT